MTHRSDRTDIKVGLLYKGRNPLGELVGNYLETS